MKNNISVQLYSVKDATQNDFMGTLEKIAKMGYGGVEFAGFGGYSADEIKSKLSELSLEPSGAHIAIDALREDIDGIIAFNKKIGNKYIVVPYADVKSKDDAVSLNKEFKEFEKKLSANGLAFAYHNHAHEMDKYDGEYALDIMLDGDGLLYEVDTFWTEYAGVDTESYLKKLADRCPLVHLKDMAPDRESAVYGEGILDNKKIINASKKYCNPEWFIIEWEAFGSCDCMYAVEKSINNLKKLL